LAEGSKWTEAKEDQRIERGWVYPTYARVFLPLKLLVRPALLVALCTHLEIKVTFDFRLSNCFWILVVC
jgi:hypothetical protein